MSCRYLFSRISVGAALAILSTAAPSAGAAQATGHAAENHVQTGQFRIPESIRAEHVEIHSELVSAMKIPGRIGVAARALDAVLAPHFAREEQIALPPLALLAPLSRGEFTPGMRAVLPMTDSLRAELPRMLEEHKTIVAATQRLRDVARAARNTTVVEFTDKLALHARSEEELFYPAAVLVGDLVRSRSTAPGAP